MNYIKPDWVTPALGNELKTKRLWLRPLVEEDLVPLAAMHADAETMRFWPRPLTFEENRVFLERQWVRYERDGYGFFAAVLQETGELVGRIGYLRQDEDGRPDLEIAYLLDRAHWGKGLASEAALALRDHAFQCSTVDRVISLIRPENVRSRRVAERMGMQVRGEVSHADLPHLLHAIYREEWQELPGQGQVTRS